MLCAIRNNYNLIVRVDKMYSLGRLYTVHRENTSSNEPTIFMGGNAASQLILQKLLQLFHPHRYKVILICLVLWREISKNCMAELKKNCYRVRKSFAS